jgi:hypothetical protein
MALSCPTQSNAVAANMTMQQNNCLIINDLASSDHLIPFYKVLKEAAQIAPACLIKRFLLQRILHDKAVRKAGFR